MSNILMTSGRGVFALTLARCLHDAGHRVFVADNWQQYMTRYSAAVEQTFQVPPPAQETKAWVNALAKIVTDRQIDLIVPVYEEIFYLAQAAEELSQHARLFAADFDTLMTLHSKWLFNQKALELGLAVPRTQLITGREQLLAAFADDGQNLVFKPAYSRFAAFAVVRPESEADLEKVDPTPAKPWVAQQYLPGRPIATFSVAQQGRIVAHSTYAAEFSLGAGPTTAYRSIEHPAAFEWVSELVDRLNITGQIGLDFMEDGAGGVSAIECNPRLTGGMFLLKDNPLFPSVYVDPNAEFVPPSNKRSYVFRLGLFFTIMKHTQHFPGAWEWAKTLLLGKSTVGFKWRDPMPAILEPILNIEFVRRCKKAGMRGEELVTVDMEWNHEPDVAPLSEDDQGHRRSAQVSA